jgi:hypothetical protein
MLGQYLQLALIAPEPYVSTYKIKYKNENPITLLETNLYNQYLIFPPTGTNEKEIEWLSYDVYYPDYLASFKPLTADITYNFGFESGEREGYNNGYNTGYSNGYNIGHTDGYNEGSIDTQYGVNTVVSFNQLVKNGNFETVSDWKTWEGGLYTTSNNTATFQASNNNSQLYTQNMPTSVGHKLFITASVKCSTNTNCVLSARGVYWDNLKTFTSEDYETYNAIITGISNYSYILLAFNINADQYPSSVKIKDVMLIDLTNIYGVGNEPLTIDSFKNDFPSTYYPYTQESLINIDYENGYIKGQKLGYNLGYDDGKDAQATQQLTSTGWIGSIFSGISSLLNIQIFPGVTIGIIVGIPFVISLAYFVIRAFRGGGGA